MYKLKGQRKGLALFYLLPFNTSFKNAVVVCNRVCKDLTAFLKTQALALL
jgi:hypothetical protein